MAYTVSHLYEKVSEGVDKIGSDLFTLKYVMNRLEVATYDFIGETVKYMENTQEMRDDILPLVKPYRWNIIELPEFGGQAISDIVLRQYGFALPSDYLHLVSFKVIGYEDPYTGAVQKIRDTRLVRHGQEEIYHTDPHKKPSAEYPLLVLYEDHVRVYGGGIPLNLEGMYITKPTFWVYDEDADFDVEIAVNLPDNSVEKIIKDVISDILITIGDPRAQVKYQAKEQYRIRG